jgi:hypothetical protein
MLQVLMAALQADPSIALWGQGWGEISITADRFRTASDAILWNGSWDGFDRNVSHSANMFVEAVFGAGLPAALFVVFLLISPLLVADAKHLPPVFFVAIVFASVSSTWPQVAMTVGMTTLALALASGDVAGKPWHRRISRPVIWGLPVVVALLFTGGSWLLSEGLSYRQQIQDVRARGTQSPHACSLHQNSAYFPSPFDEAVVLTADGVGEWATTSVAIGRGNTLETTREMHFPHSLGLLYSALTYYTGFKVNSGEYKVMGLAPYGEPRFKDLILEKLVDLKSDGSFRLDQQYFDYCTGLTMTNDKFADLFGEPVRDEEEVLTQFHMDIAASV